MTGFQWVIVVYTAMVAFLGIACHGREVNKKINVTDIVLKLVIINWALWYAGAWN